MKLLKTLGKKLLISFGFYESYAQYRAIWRKARAEIKLYRRHRSACRKVPHILKTVHPLNLEFGGWKRQKPGWINVDLFSSAADLTLDLRLPLPFPDESVDNVYSEHVLEHFSYPAPLATILEECFRILKVGGVFSAAVPDFGKAFKLYAQDNENNFYAQKFWSNPTPNWCTGPMDDLNWLVYMESQHQFMFDNQNIINHLVQAGFSQVQLRDFDSSLDSGRRRHQSLYVQAVKEAQKN